MKNLGVTDYLDQGIAAEPGDIIYCNEDNQVYEYYDEGLGKPFGWRPYDVNKSAMINLGITEYEINKMIIAQLPSLISNEQLAPSRELIKNFTHQHSFTGNAYYMLLCNDLRYYTVFNVYENRPDEENVENVVIDCLQDMGVIQQINPTEDGKAIECWIKNDKGTFMFMLFRYDWGVIICQ